ncbi:MAG: 6-carboxytetrahydropterin synthase [Bryobacterales bacterium]|nr:6-carboxytetrahydropterin synthase [Bryobacterales bacterium]MBV9401892.1 6-carboxytetrahydropterin synthase [Bryobacterales bacterium]
MRLTRRYRFAASHRLHTPALSEEENRRLYGKCANPFGHGHDYILDVTVEGPVNADGRLVDRAALDGLVRRHALARVEYRNLNQDLPEFAHVVPTTENLASLVRDLLLDGWDLPARLAHLRISETDRNAFDLEVGRN